ncbi:MAG: nucleotide pyrophosphohydrolase [Nanoarchaeota archaeon]|nr:nucleotide pyrophosphohydrolase [Nanoarchaeota archaeon]MBU1134889.1 nucleotide pyrophosphohydrolase [Nanoarchaeota archaeon]MBU2520397.1 nucleotide pyrophosphohydrolase [Nanoarchaeota archaeon]
MKWDKVTKVDELKNTIHNFNKQREWHKYHNPKNLSVSIAIEVAELMQHFQWLKEEDIENEIQQNQEKFTEIKEEIADVLIYCLCFANHLDIDITEAILNKIEKNSLKYPNSIG